MERRRERRWPRVLDVRFWKPGEEDARRRASATNISRGGLFIRTSTVVPGGTRLRVEVIHARHGFVCEGVVVRALRTPSQYQSVQPSGMGIRFLAPGELVEELLPHMASVERSATTNSATTSSGSEAGRDASRGIGTASRGTSASIDSPGRGRAVSSSSAEDGSPGTMQLDDRVFEILFRDRERFRKVFDRDVQTGGIFVPTDDPAPMDEVVRVRVRVEGAGAEAVEARVVHSVPLTDTGVEGGNLLAGMGVQFSDVARAVARLRRLLEG